MEQKCSSEHIYTFNSNNFESAKIRQLETKNYFINIVHFDRRVSYTHHQLSIAKKTHPNRLFTYNFDGIAFEIVSLELDKHSHSEEFLVIDKPSARGYRYSVLPSPLSVLENDLKANKLCKTQRNMLSFGHFLKVITQCLVILTTMEYARLLTLQKSFNVSLCTPNGMLTQQSIHLISLSQAKLNKPGTK